MPCCATATAPLLVSTEVEDGGYPALSPARPAAAWFERMVHDLWGHTAIGGTDQRPWLDHGHWPISAPLALRPGPPGRSEAPEFLFPAELDQLPLGPVRGGIEPAAHLRLGIRGETIVRLEARLGYTHKGTLTLMRGKSPRAAARFAARLAGRRRSRTRLPSLVRPRPRWAARFRRGARHGATSWPSSNGSFVHLDALAAMAEAAGLEMLSARPRLAWRGAPSRGQCRVRSSPDDGLCGSGRRRRGYRAGRPRGDRPRAVRACGGVAGAAGFCRRPVAS